MKARRKFFENYRTQGFDIGTQNYRLHFYFVRDKQTWGQLFGAWRLGDIRNLTRVPIPGTRCYLGYDWPNKRWS